MQLAIGLYDGFTALDFVGPYQVFSNLPGTEVVLCAEHEGTVTDDNGLLRLGIDQTFDDVVSPDVLLVPGGFVTRRIAAAGGAIVEWIRSAHETTTWTTSVCTGALLLGAAGLLDGRPTTTHWLAFDELSRYGAEPTAARVVVDGRIATSAGVSAGIDMALTLVDRIAGPEMSQAIQLGLEYDPRPPYDAGSPSKADPAIRDLVRAFNDAAEASLGAR